MVVEVPTRRVPSLRATEAPSPSLHFLSLSLFFFFFIIILPLLFRPPVLPRFIKLTPLDIPRLLLLSIMQVYSLLLPCSIYTSTHLSPIILPVNSILYLPLSLFCCLCVPVDTHALSCLSSWSTLLVFLHANHNLRLPSPLPGCSRASI